MRLEAGGSFREKSYHKTKAKTQLHSQRVYWPVSTLKRSKNDASVRIILFVIYPLTVQCRRNFTSMVKIMLMPSDVVIIVSVSI